LKTVDIFQVDAFTDKPFCGNPAGVVPDANSLTEHEMQLIAREMNLSETAFVLEPTAPEADFRVRFFTPTDEVDLCGHATIATFHLLAEFDKFDLAPGINVFKQETAAGILPVEVHTDRMGNVTRVMMHQVLPQIISTIDNEESIADMLGTESLNIQDAPGDVQIVSTGLPDLIVPIYDRESLDDLEPDMEDLRSWCRRHDVIGVHAFCFAPCDDDTSITVYCRDFAPVVGIPEESATGTANGALGAYLVLNELVPIETPTTYIFAAQGHKLDRPSVIWVEVETDGKAISAVKVGGTAVTVFRGEFVL